MTNPEDQRGWPERLEELVGGATVRLEEIPALIREAVRATGLEKALAIVREDYQELCRELIEERDAALADVLRLEEENTKLKLESHYQKHRDARRRARD